jgi:phosphate transport system substrate-binding protein
VSRNNCFAKGSLRLIAFLALLMTVVACAPTTTGQGPTNATTLSGTIAVDGSSTVFPITEAVAEEFQKQNPKVRVTVGISGTGGGFQKFCNRETDISDASRPIRSSEIEACSRNGREFIELPVAFDGLSVVVHPQNSWASSMTVEELRRLWEPAAQGTITRWSQIRPGWPDRPIRLYGPGTASGTFDYFTEVIVGRSGASRGDYTASEDDNVLVQGVAGDPDALGYFGYAYYIENQGRVKVVAIDSGNGPVLPSLQTINDGTYTPLSRPLFIYVAADAATRPEVQEFIRFYLTEGRSLVPQVGYIQLPAPVYEAALRRFEGRLTGSAYTGAPAGAKLEDLYR